MMRTRASIAAIAAGAVALVAPNVASAQVADASASPGQASSAAVDLPGVATVGKSTTGAKGSEVQVINVAGVNVLGKAGGQNTGLLAPVGALVDQVNGQTCKDPAKANCVLILFSGQNDRTTKSELGTATTSNASYATLGIGAIKVLGSQSASIKQTPAGADSSRCTDLARGYVLVTGTPVVPSSVQGLDNTATSVNKAC